MRGKVAKRLRTFAGFKPGTTVRYLRAENGEDKSPTIQCGRPRSTYLNLKKEYYRGEVKK